jgi:hypothetical protein
MSADKPEPADLTTSDWVDYLQGMTRDEQILALSAYHRRVEEICNADKVLVIVPKPPRAKKRKRGK